MNKEYNFDIKLAGLDGKVHPNALHLGEYLAELLAGDTTSPADSLKYTDWARVLYVKEDLSLDRTDKDKLKSFVETTQGSMTQGGFFPGVPAYYRSQILEILENPRPKKNSAATDTDDKS